MSAKYASLHAGLLARKGEASPALPEPAGSLSHADRPHRRDADLPRSGDGLVAPKSGSPSPRSSLKTGPQKPGQPAMDTPAPASPQGGCCSGAAAPNSPPPLPGPDAPLVFRASVRLTAEQKRRLGTVSVQMSWSQQRILALALDEWLDRLCTSEMKDCACLKARKAD